MGAVMSKELLIKSGHVDRALELMHATREHLRA
jgi:hypothetical protein